MLHRKRFNYIAVYSSSIFALIALASAVQAMGNKHGKTNSSDRKASMEIAANATAVSGGAAAGEDVDRSGFNEKMREAAKRDTRIAELEQKIKGLSVKGRRGRWSNAKKAIALDYEARIGRLQRGLPEEVEEDEDASAAAQSSNPGPDIGENALHHAARTRIAQGRSGLLHGADGVDYFDDDGGSVSGASADDTAVIDLGGLGQEEGGARSGGWFAIARARATPALGRAAETSAARAACASAAGRRRRRA